MKTAFVWCAVGTLGLLACAGCGRDLMTEDFAKDRPPVHRLPNPDLGPSKELPPQGEMRTWTPVGGKPQEGQFVEFRDNMVTVQLKKGGRISFPLDKFSAEDQQYVRSQSQK